MNNSDSKALEQKPDFYAIPKLEQSYGDLKEIPDGFFKEMYDAAFYYKKHFHPSQKYRSEEFDIIMRAAQKVLPGILALQSENLRLTEENSELHLKSAELHSLRMSILESPLKEFFPEKEMSFHDKVIFGIHDLKHQKLLAWEQMQEVNKDLKTETERLTKINEELVKALERWISVEDRLPDNNTKVVGYDTDSLTNEKPLLFVNGQFLYIAYGIALDYTPHVTKWKYRK